MRLGSSSTWNGTCNCVHVAFQQTEVSGHVVMEVSDLIMLRPEVDWNIVRGLLLISVASTKHRVSDITSCACCAISHTQSGRPGSDKGT